MSGVSQGQGSPMTDAREWLEDAHACAQGDDRVEGQTIRATTTALLAVLDECDRLDGEESGVYPGIWFDALAHASDRIHDAIDKALGGESCACGHPWEKHGPEAPGCVECGCDYIREGVR